MTDLRVFFYWSFRCLNFEIYFMEKIAGNAGVWVKVEILEIMMFMRDLFTSSHCLSFSSTVSYLV